MKKILAATLALGFVSSAALADAKKEAPKKEEKAPAATDAKKDEAAPAADAKKDEKAPAAKDSKAPMKAKKDAAKPAATK
ncbi:MAG TPA: hypothetical protein VGM39_09115 [Kofleriaceae bacterium]|jgi:hypothetical protein